MDIHDFGYGIKQITDKCVTEPGGIGSLHKNRYDANKQVEQLNSVFGPGAFEVVDFC